MPVLCSSESCVDFTRTGSIITLSKEMKVKTTLVSLILIVAVCGDWQIEKFPILNVAILNGTSVFEVQSTFEFYSPPPLSPIAGAIEGLFLR